MANLIITNRCNLECFYCYVDVFNPDRQHLNLQEKRVINRDNLIELVDTLYDRGCRLIVLLGGEPLMFKEIGEIIRHIKSKKMVTAMDSIARTLEEDGDDVLAVVLQNPNFFGLIEPMENAGKLLGCGQEGTEKPPDRPLLISIVDPISLGVLKDPGAYGADIAIGDGQQLGNSPNLGGPTFGFFTTLQKHVRKVPGRIVGETVDSDGRRGYVLTFQTREQHIRRERATSNICTNQGLCSLRGAMYLAFLGSHGIRKVAEASTRLAHYAHGVLTGLEGVEAVSSATFFQEFALKLPVDADTVYRALAERNIGGGLPLARFFPGRDQEMLFAFTELVTKKDIDHLGDELGRVLSEELREAKA